MVQDARSNYRASTVSFFLLELHQCPRIGILTLSSWDGQWGLRRTLAKALGLRLVRASNSATRTVDIKLVGSQPVQSSICSLQLALSAVGVAEQKSQLE